MAKKRWERDLVRLNVIQRLQLKNQLNVEFRFHKVESLNQ